MFNDLLYSPGQDNLAGIIGEAYICPQADINSVPALSAVGSLVTVVSAITNKTGKKFYRIYMTDESGKLESKAVGDRDGKAWETVFSMKYPGDDSSLAQFVRDWGNTPAVLIVKDAKTGLFKLLGVTNPDKTATTLTTDIPAYFENGDISSGGKRSDSRGATLSWKFTCAHPPITYMSTVPLTPA